MVKARELLPAKPPVGLERADALLQGLWEEGLLDLRQLQDNRLYVRCLWYCMYLGVCVLLLCVHHVVCSLACCVQPCMLFFVTVCAVNVTTQCPMQEALQQVNTLRHEVDMVLVWLEQMEVGLEDKQASLQAQQDAKQADAQDRQRALLGEVVAAVVAPQPGT